ncbi:MAG: TetR/AcrR family transcriptional regulator [Gammaproteobacteria bacterium]
MHAATSTPTSEGVRSLILDIAEARFRRYSFRKTTMAEIAVDAGMSPANLYRYFDNKQALCAECGHRCMGRRIDALRTVARGCSGTAAQRLHEFARTNLAVTFELVAEQPHIHELVQTISADHPDLVRDNLKSITGLIAEILEYGNSAGEFDVEDVIDTASAVHAAMVLYEVPIFSQLMSREELEHSAENVVALLVRGLRRV